MASQAALDLVVEERKASRPSNVGVYQAMAPAGAPGDPNQLWRSMPQHEYTLNFLVSGTKDEAIVRERIEDRDYGLPRLFHGRKWSQYTTNYIGNLQWDVTATYSDQLVNCIVSASTGGGTQTITKAFQEVARYPDAGASNPAPDMQGAVEFEDGKVKGIDVPTANIRIVYVWRIPRVYYEAAFDVSGLGNLPDDQSSAPHGGSYQNWLHLLSDYTGCVCGSTSGGSAGWYIYGEREVMLTDAVPRLINNDTMEVQLEYDIRLTYKLTLPDTIENSPQPGGPGQEITVRGHDYVWYRYASKQQGSGRKFVYPIATHAYVDQVKAERLFHGVLPIPDTYYLSTPIVADGRPTDDELDTVNVSDETDLCAVAPVP